MGILRWLGFTPLMRAHITVRSQIYEGGYHFHAERCARRYGMKGWMRVVRKEMYEYIEMEVEGRQHAIQKLVEALRLSPTSSKANGLEIQWKTYKKLYHAFHVKH